MIVSRWCDKLEKWKALVVCEHKLSIGECVMKGKKCRPKQLNHISEEERERRRNWMNEVNKRRVTT